MAHKNNYIKPFYFLSLCFFTTLVAYPQTPIRVLYLTDPVPFATGDGKHDQEMFDIIKNLGYEVTAEAISATSATEGYNVIFLSDAIGSANAYWGRYKEAPMPMVMGKVMAVKGPALGWISNDNSGIDYSSDVDSIFVKIADHPINDDLNDKISVVHPGSAEGAIGAYVSLPETPGVVPVMSLEGEPDHHSINAIEKSTTLNGIKLQNRVAIFGVNQVVYDKLSSDTQKLLNNCIRWVVSGSTGIENDKVSEFVTVSAYPNPAGNFFTIDCKYYSDFIIKLTDLSGRIILQQTFEDQLYQMDISQYKSGIYFLEVSDRQTGEQILTEKLIKN